MKSEYLKSCRCPICKAVVITRKRDGLKPSLLKALAMASHVKALHPQVVR